MSDMGILMHMFSNKSSKIRPAMSDILKFTNMDWKPQCRKKFLRQTFGKFITSQERWLNLLAGYHWKRQRWERSEHAAVLLVEWSLDDHFPSLCYLQHPSDCSDLIWGCTSHRQKRREGAFRTHFCPSLTQSKQSAGSGRHIHSSGRHI